MSRYVNELPLRYAPDAVFNNAYAFLISEGYTYTIYNNEYLFKKGTGFLAAPSFVKLSLYNNIVRVEAWIKFALFPGVFVGEMDLEGFVGIAVKKPLKKRVQKLESLIMTGAVYQAQTANAPMYNGQMYGAPANNGQMYGTPVNNGQMYGTPANNGQMYGAPVNNGQMYGTPANNGQMYGAPVNNGQMYGTPVNNGQMYGAPVNNGQMYGGQSNGDSTYNGQ